MTQQTNDKSLLIMCVADLAYSGYQDVVHLFQLMLKNAQLNSEFQLVSPGEIMNKAKQMKPDLILVGIRLLDQEAIERWKTEGLCMGKKVVKSLKADPQTQHIPILVVEALVDIEKAALACGADDYLSLPVSPLEFENKVKKLISHE